MAVSDIGTLRVDREALPAAYAADRKLSTLRVYADWLEERGEYAEALLIRETPHVWLVGGPEAWAQLLADLDRANGRRRERTLDPEDLVNLIHSARDDRVHDWCSICGGTVANCYGYRSYQTVAVAAVRSDGRVRCGVAVTSGSKGSSPTTPVTGLTRNAKPVAFRAWADAAKEVARA